MSSRRTPETPETPGTPGAAGRTAAAGPKKRKRQLSLRFPDHPDRIPLEWGDLPYDCPSTPTVRFRISDTSVKRTLRKWKKSGVLPHIEAKMGGHPGKPSQLPATALLVAADIAAQLFSRYLRTDANIVLNSISLRSAGLLGMFRDGIEPGPVSYNVTEDQAKKFETLIADGWTAEDGTRCDLEWLAFNLIRASIPPDAARKIAAIAMDQTAAAAWAVTKRFVVEAQARAARDNPDNPDHDLYADVEYTEDKDRVVRGADDDALAIHKSGTNKMPPMILTGFFHNLAVATRRLTWRGDPNSIDVGEKMPCYIVAFNVTNDQDPSHGIRLLDDAEKITGNRLQVHADQGYTRHVEEFLAPLRKRGHEPFLQVPVTARKNPKKVHVGKNQTEFWYFCDSFYPTYIREERLLPDAADDQLLREADEKLLQAADERLLRDPDTAKNGAEAPPGDDEEDEKIAELVDAKKRLHNHFAGLTKLAWTCNDRLDDGKIQLECPQCSGRITSNRKTRRKGVEPQVTAEYVEADSSVDHNGEILQCCEQSTITITAEEARHFQRPPYGTRANDIAVAYRNPVEGVFGQIGDKGGYKAGWCRVLKHPAQFIGGLMLALTHNARTQQRDEDDRSKANRQRNNRPGADENTASAEPGDTAPQPNAEPGESAGSARPPPDPA